MNRNSLVSSLAFLVFSLLVGCAGPTETDPKDDHKKAVQVWSKAHSEKDLDVLSDLYHATVLYYGQQLQKNDCMLSKLSFFNKHPDYYQQIYGEIQVDDINENEVKCSFVKRVTLDTKSTDYPSYLVFRKEGGSWKIITESDLVTDKNLSNPKPRTIPPPKDAVRGDFNADGRLEYMWLAPPKIDETGTGCVGRCTSYIKFSDPGIPSIPVENSIGGLPQNKGDLNLNGGDEIGLLPDWFASCWRDYCVWSFINGRWVFAVTPFSTHCNQWDMGVEPIEIDRSRQGYVIIRYSEHTGEDIITKWKSVPIKR